MQVDIVKITKDKREEIKDIVTNEVPFTIHLNGRELLTLLSSPDNLKELTIGFLYSSGLINSIDQVKNITIDTRNWISHIDLTEDNKNDELVFKRLYTSGCGKGTLIYNTLDLIHKRKITNSFKISAEKIVRLMRTFQNSSVNFKETGGVHSAALSDGENISVFKEDIGRHNAIDKVVGEALIKKLKFKDFIILTSGRISSEIVFKIMKISVPCLISRSAPTDQAVKLARSIGLTLIGFVRGSRMNVYSGEDRLV